MIPNEEDKQDETVNRLRQNVNSCVASLHLFDTELLVDIWKLWWQIHISARRRTTLVRLQRRLM